MCGINVPLKLASAAQTCSNTMQEESAVAPSTQMMFGWEPTRLIIATSLLKVSRLHVIRGSSNLFASVHVCVRQRSVCGADMREPFIARTFALGIFPIKVFIRPHHFDDNLPISSFEGVVDRVHLVEEKEICKSTTNENVFFPRIQYLLFCVEDGRLPNAPISALAHPVCDFKVASLELSQARLCPSEACQMRFSISVGGPSFVTVMDIMITAWGTVAHSH